MGYVPERGDLIWLDFSVQSGHEQGGKHPAVVLSPGSYNRKVGLAICCPITRIIKGYPFEVRVPPGKKVIGAILSDHLKNLDWRSRTAIYIDSIDSDTLADVISKVHCLLAFE